MFRRLVTLAAFGVALAAASPGLAASFGKLLTPAALDEIRAEPGLRILDIRAAEGEPSYAAGHIPGAVSAPYPTWRGPSSNPGAALGDAALTDLLQTAGIDAATPVVIVYQGETQSDFGAAARVYWTLKSAGLTRLAILNGGFRAWTEAGLPVSTDQVTPERSTIEAALSPEWMATREQVRDIVAGRSDAVLVDARPEAFFRGEQKHDAAKGFGTIANAVSFVNFDWFGPEQTVISEPEAAIARAREIAAKANGAPIVSFCNTGHWAATNWFALSELAGVDNVKLYPESVVGWSNANLPLVVGN
jgi:thiosulfate/3-mercaptopyruvate sulfurtransferase